TTSFQLPWRGGELVYTGRLGEDVSVEDGYEAARICALKGIAQLADAAGSLDRISQVLRLEGHVGCTPDCGDIPQVLNRAAALAVHRALVAARSVRVGGARARARRGASRQGNADARDAAHRLPGRLLGLLRRARRSQARTRRPPVPEPRRRCARRAAPRGSRR